MCVGYNIDQETKRLSLLWKRSFSLFRRKAKVASSENLSDSVNICECNGIVFTDYLQKGYTIDAAYYAIVIKQF